MDYGDFFSNDDDDIEFNVEESAFLKKIYNFSSTQAKSKESYKDFLRLAQNMEDEDKKFEFYQTAFASPLRKNKRIVSVLKKRILSLGTSL